MTVQSDYQNCLKNGFIQWGRRTMPWGLPANFNCPMYFKELQICINHLSLMCPIKEIIIEGYYIKPFQKELVIVKYFLYCKFFNKTHCLHIKFGCLLDTLGAVSCEIITIITDKNRQDTELVYFVYYLHHLLKAMES